MRLLAIDPGEQQIGVAVSDVTGLIARPLTTLKHTARAADAARLVSLATEQQAAGIVVGLALDAEGQAGPQARRAERLAAALRQLTALPVILYDESHSTQTAHAARLASGQKRRARQMPVHAAAAAAILQSYLDAHSAETPTD
jgi:putative Holliday junction resolvase